MTTEELIHAFEQRLTHGHRVDDLVAELSHAVEQLQTRLTSPDSEERDRTRQEATKLQEEIAKLARLGENRMSSLQTELGAIHRKGSLDRLYGRTSHGPWQ